MRSSAGAETVKRPVAVSLVALLAVGVALYSGVYGIIVLHGAEGDAMAEGILRLVLGAGALVAGLGAFRVLPWAWTAFMVWAVIGLTNEILRYFFFGDPNYADMAITTFAVLALSPLDVQHAFGLRHTEHVRLDAPSRDPLERH